VRAVLRFGDLIVSIVITLAIVGVAAFGVFTVIELSKSEGTTYRVALPDAQKLEVSNPVRVAGADRGKVTKIELNDEDTGAIVTFRVDTDVPVYEDVHVRLRSRGLDADRYLDLIPGSEGTRSWPTKDVIPQDRTTTPIDLEDLATQVTPEIEQTLHPFLETANTALNGKAQELGQLIQNLSEFSKALADGLEPKTENIKALVDNSAVVLKALADKQGELKRLVTEGDQFFGSLAENNQEIATLIESSDVFFNTLATKNQQLAQLLNASDQFFGAIASRNAQLNQLIDFADRTMLELAQDTDALLRTSRQAADFNRGVLQARDDFSLFLKLIPQDVQLWSDIFLPTQGKIAGLMGVYTTDPPNFRPLPVSKTGNGEGR
jgi:phospholipid/cholesterol/gamma-HCH transport system substrate-binding protein